MMRKYLFAMAECREEPVRYYLLSEREGYGIGVEYKEEVVLLRGLDRALSGVEDLLRAMVRGCVTPTTARDVAEDWLLAGNP